MTHNNQEERSVEELDEIQRLIVEKDPDDNDKFLRQLWDLVAQAKETFHHQLQKARQDWLQSEIEKLESLKQVAWKNQDHICRFNDGDQTCDCYNTALTSIITRYKEELLELDKTNGF